MQWHLIALLLCALILPVSAIQIIEFCPDPYLPDDPDEYIVLSGTGTLDGVVVSDGEGGFRFPPGSRISGTVTIARDATGYQKTHGLYPDFEWYDYSPHVPNVIRGGTLRMGNAEDQLFLYLYDREIQRVSWPADVHPREGQIHYLEDGVWDPRPLLIGQSRFRPVVISNVSLTAFVSPDSSREVFTQAVMSADRKILLNIYEFTDRDLARLLSDAAGRGVDTRILVEGGPVGGITPEERHICTLLNQSGIAISQMATTAEAHAKYRFNHAKYMVIDDDGLFITSENFKESGFPPAGFSGNRGWGAFIENEELAGYFQEVYHWDSQGGDIIPVKHSAGNYRDPVYEPYAVEYPPVYVEGAKVTPVLAPDTSSLIREMLEGAQVSIDIEQAYITNQSYTTLHPFLESAINASRRGVRVRILLDSYWFNVDEPADNDEMVACINRIARAEDLPLSARIADLEANHLDKIHNKGAIVDGQRVLISSINWNDNSPNFNREAGVIIDHPVIGAYFTQVFEDDWDPSSERSDDETDHLKTAGAIAVVAVFVLLYVYKKRG
jgi:cardiolipin synthase A/B